MTVSFPFSFLYQTHNSAGLVVSVVIFPNSSPENCPLPATLTEGGYVIRMGRYIAAQDAPGHHEQQEQGNVESVVKGALRYFSTLGRFLEAIGSKVSDFTIFGENLSSMEFSR